MKAALIISQRFLGRLGSEKMKPKCDMEVKKSKSEDAWASFFLKIDSLTLLKEVPGGFPKSDLLGVTVALIHVAAQRFLAV